MPPLVEPTPPLPGPSVDVVEVEVDAEVDGDVFIVVVVDMDVAPKLVVGVVVVLSITSFVELEVGESSVAVGLSALLRKEVVPARDCSEVAEAGVGCGTLALMAAKLFDAAAESVSSMLTVEVVVVMDEVTIEASIAAE